MSGDGTHFTRTACWLHWSMAAMILTMLFIGVAMVASLELRPWLLDLHRPLGLLVLLLAFVRLWHRRRNPPPALPASLPPLQARLARNVDMAVLTRPIDPRLFQTTVAMASDYIRTGRA